MKILRSLLTACALGATLATPLGTPLATPVVAAPAAPPALPQGLDILAAHLAATRTMTADFKQTAMDGRVATGKFLLQRPGKVRFAYEEGSPFLIVANGKSLVMIDYDSKQVQRYPIGSTALSVLLDSNPNLTRFARTLSSSATQLTVEARDPKKPEYGVITLFFARDAQAPGGLALYAWRVLDANGSVTQIELSNTRFNVEVPASAFTYRDPRGHPGPRTR